MVYYLFTYIDKVWDIPGAGLFQYIIFRAGLAAATGTAPEDYATVRPPGATQIAALKVDVRG
jgi:hypothetical protein